MRFPACANCTHISSQGWLFNTSTRQQRHHRLQLWNQVLQAAGYHRQPKLKNPFKLDFVSLLSSILYGVQMCAQGRPQSPQLRHMSHSCGKSDPSMSGIGNVYELGWGGLHLITRGRCFLAPSATRDCIVASGTLDGHQRLDLPDFATILQQYRIFPTARSLRAAHCRKH